MSLWDTAGQERFDSLTSLYLKGAYAAIIVYDITDQRSFEKAQFWSNQVKQYDENNPIAVFIVANKIDLIES